MDFSENAGNGLNRCLVCNSTLGCETWCPRRTLTLYESEADKARRMLVCREIVTLRRCVDSRIAELIRLRRVVDGVRALKQADFGQECLAAWSLIDAALAELDGGKV